MCTVETARKINQEDAELIGLSLFKRIYRDAEGMYMSKKNIKL
jgi:hypothetical protein